MESRKGNFDPFHVKGTDSEFSEFWTKHKVFILKTDFPQWIKLCNEVLIHFDRGNFSTYNTELNSYYGLRAGSGVTNYGDISYLGEACEIESTEVVSEAEYKKRRSELANEIEHPMWSLGTLTRLIKCYLEYRYHKMHEDSACVEEECSMHDISKKIVDQFLIKIIDEIINPIADEAGKYRHRIVIDDKIYDGLIADLRSFVLGLDQQSSTSNCSLPVTSSPVMSPDVALDSSYVTPPTRGNVRADLSVSDKKSAVKPNWRTPILLVAGAITGVLVLGIVIAATHGVALPFIAGIGVGILAGHGGAAAGLALGCSLFASAAAVLGAGVTYAAKKTYDFARWCLCRQRPATETNIMHSASTTSLLHESMSLPRDYETIHDVKATSPLIDDHASRGRAGRNQSSIGRSWASLFCCGRVSSRQQLVEPVNHSQRILGRPL